MNVTLLKQRLDLQREINNLHSKTNESVQMGILRKISYLNEILREENAKREQNV